jgi:amidohydrolase
LPLEIRDMAAALSDRLVAWRRRLHEHPELSGQEHQTAALIAEELRSLGLDPTPRVGGGCGVTAELRVDDRAPTIALRADMDALPVEEETGVEYASRNKGAMHACGHDAHVAMLLGAAALLSQQRERLRHNVRLIFQPHEELYPGGAPAMIEAGVLDGVNAIFGIHICSDLEVGRLGTRPGPFMAAMNTFHLTVIGRGGHAAMPDKAVDPVVAAANIVLALQTVVTRSVPIAEPAVVSVTQMTAGTAPNVIPQQVEMHGTMRTFNEAVRSRVATRIREIADSVARAHGAEVQVEIEPGYPVLVNHEAITRRALSVAYQIGFDDAHIDPLDPQGGGEDFAYYCQKVPGAFVFLGARNEGKDCVYPHHHPRFNIDEDALPAGAALHAAFALSDQPLE